MADTAPETALPPSMSAAIGMGESAVSIQKSQIRMRIPSKYASGENEAGWLAPSLEWLYGTWSVTHSTLPIWKKAKNVRITYRKMEGKEGCLDDTVESDPVQKSWTPHMAKHIEGIDTPDPKISAAWNWRGKGFLKISSSHWEVLGWGERLVNGRSERWAVTWFAPTIFTPQGLDVYSDQAGGIDEALYQDIMAALTKSLEGGEASKDVAQLIKNAMVPVMITLDH